MIEAHNKTILRRKCKALNLTKSMDYPDAAYQEDYNEINKLIQEGYRYSDVLCELSSMWGFDKAMIFAKKSSRVIETHSCIQTIATSYYRSYNGGIERSNATLMSMFSKMGYKVIFFTEEEPTKDDYNSPVEVERIIVPGLSNICERLKLLQTACEEHGVDLFINHYWSSTETLWELLLFRMLQIPYIYYTHGLFTYGLFSTESNMSRFDLYRISDLVLTLAEVNVMFYRSLGCNTYLVQNPIPDELLTTKVKHEAPTNRILMIGRISGEKRPMDALKIFNNVHSIAKDVYLDIVGDGDDELVSEMHKYVKMNNLTDRVIFHGFKNGDSIEEYYKKATCVLLTSETEGYGYVILESKAYGVPLVMYDLPYLSLTMDDLGVLKATLGDINRMSELVISLMNNSDVRRIKAKEAAQSFEKIKKLSAEKEWSRIFEHFEDGKVLDDGIVIDKSSEQAVRLLIESTTESLYSNRDYQFGKKLLKYPRLVKKALRRL
ncbi:MAG: glycosyltransferase family 4 protein [Lachnospiraceae bacterium]|nr:glycosyltransferase family 4 protein [Lachnospiraceae bacterium]